MKIYLALCFLMTAAPASAVETPADTVTCDIPIVSETRLLSDPSIPFFVSQEFYPIYSTDATRLPFPVAFTPPTTIAVSGEGDFNKGYGLHYVLFFGAGKLAYGCDYEWNGATALVL